MQTLVYATVMAAQLHFTHVAQVTFSTCHAVQAVPTI